MTLNRCERIERGRLPPSRWAWPEYGGDYFQRVFACRRNGGRKWPGGTWRGGAALRSRAGRDRRRCHSLARALILGGRREVGAVTSRTRQSRQ